MTRDRTEQNTREPIAIVGIGCRFPGAAGPGALWKLLCDGVDAIGEVPPSRMDMEAIFHPEPGTPGKTVARFGGFLDGIERFDADFFGIAPREAERLDPQQRLLLEVAWEAMEDAGLPPRHRSTKQTGVFVGMWINDYEVRMMDGLEKIDFYKTLGSGRYSASGRVSFSLGFQGPSVTLDTACSSSLVSLHLACQSLLSGECDLALAGGANTILQPYVQIAYSQSKMLAPDGRCKFGDARANGYVRSEGAALVALKRLSRAEADGDPIYAVIRGSSVNNDGDSGGFLATPSQAGQEEMVRLACRAAAVDPSEIDYVEAHGTGTAAGDPVELGALGATFGQSRPKDRPLLVGSIKTNIGHTEGAAGIAGVIKTALALRHRRLPASLHHLNPNPNIPWDELNVRVNAEMRDWPGDGPGLAGVSSFGISGTNSHVILEGMPRRSGTETSRKNSVDVAQASPPAKRACHALTVSATGEKALAERARGWRDWLADLGGEVALEDACFTAARRRAHLSHRVLIAGRTAEKMVERIDKFLQGESATGWIAGAASADPPRRPVFVFPGQGSQWLGMGRQLMRDEPVFREWIERCEAAFEGLVDWSLTEQLGADEAASRLDEIDVIQPALFAIQVASARLWQAWDVEPAAVIGHSMGEVAASVIGGAIGLEDGAAVICHRSRLMRRTSGQGAMAVVELSIAEAEKTLEGYEGRLSIAVNNAPNSTVIAGDPAALDEVLARLEERNVFCRRVKVDVASHSPQMDPLREELREAVAGVSPRKAEVPIYSTSLGEMAEGERMDAHYWEQNLRSTVKFSQGVQHLCREGFDIFIEMSPHPILTGPIQECMRAAGREGLALGSFVRNEDESAAMLASLGRLYVAGYPVDWSRLYPSGACVDLPAYPWQREFFWFDSKDFEHPRMMPTAGGAPGVALGHPLMGELHSLAGCEGTHFFESEISLDRHAWLADHAVQGRAVLPAAAFIEMALSAMRRIEGGEGFEIRDVSLSEALFLHEDESRRLQLIVETEGDVGERTFRFFSRPGFARAQPGRAGRAHSGSAAAEPAAERNGKADWRLHAEGRAVASENANRDDLKSIESQCGETAGGEKHYRAMQRRGLNYGPAFRGVAELRSGEGSVCSRIELPESVRGEAGRYALHPALLDAALQSALTAAAGDGPEDATWLPVRFERVAIASGVDSPGRCKAFARRRDGADERQSAVDVLIVDDAEQPLLHIEGLAFRRLARGLREDVSEWFYEIAWRKAEEETPEKAESADSKIETEPGTWLVFADQGGAAEDFANALAELGQTCFCVSPGTQFKSDDGRFEIQPERAEDCRRVFEEAARADQAPLRGVVYFWGHDAAATPNLDSEELERLQRRSCGGLLELTKAMAALPGFAPAEPDRALPEQSGGDKPALWIATRGAQPVGRDDAVACEQTTLWGMGRTIALEHPELKCRLIDLDPDDEKRLNRQDAKAQREEILGWLLRNGDLKENQVAVRGGERYVARLARRGGDARASGPMRLTIGSRGVLDNLKLQPATRRPPGAGEVEIRILASGLNFRDVLNAMGMYPGDPGALGLECVGVVEAVGADVKHLDVGDVVMAFASDSFQNYVTTDARYVARKPAGLNASEAATIPIAFLTTHYALNRLAKMKKGDRVLIHAASGGVGQAAVQLARRAGAEIFGTAGTPEKREFIRSLGVDHVMDSRTLDFAGEILKLTDGRGVDIVLNSLADDFIGKSFEALAEDGRFLEIGKRGIWTPEQVAQVRPRAEYRVIDLVEVRDRDPESIADMLNELVPAFENGELKPLPMREFALAEAADAFRFMAQARHIGKIVLTQETAAPPAEPIRIRKDGTWLITGGLSGLGLRFAEWLVERGARHLVLSGRSGASPAAEKRIAEMQAAGASVRVERGDVSRAEDVERILQAIRSEMPPLRGVIHAAGLLDDATLLQLDWERFARVMAPKVAGAWNLHRLTLGDDLDGFILFSSVASVLGLTGQANYCAANAFMDGLAHARRAEGRPAMSVNWGPWSEIGMAAGRDDRGSRLEAMGLGNLAPDDGLEAMARLFEAPPAQVAVMPLDARKWKEANPALQTSPFYDELIAGGEAGEGETETVDVRAALLDLEPGQPRRRFMEDHLRDQMSRVLRVGASRIDLGRPFKALGLDSLTALELRNRLETSLGISLPATAIWNYPTIAQLAPHLADRMEIPLDEEVEPEAASAPGDEDVDELLGEIENLPEEELARLLEDESVTGGRERE